MSQFFQGVVAGSLPPSVPLQFTADSGIAVPAANNLNIFGDPGIATTGSGDTITISITNVVSAYTDVVIGMSPYSVLSTDYFISCASSGGAITVRLPNAPTQYQRFVIKDRSGNASTNNITLTTVGGVVTIDGATSYLFDEDYESVEVLFNGTSYEIF